MKINIIDTPGFGDTLDGTDRLVWLNLSYSDLDIGQYLFSIKPWLRKILMLKVTYQFTLEKVMSI